jgi:hypothetical protein
VPPVVENVEAIDPYAVSATVPYLQVAASSVVSDNVVCVVPPANDELGDPLDRTGAVVSITSALLAAKLVIGVKFDMVLPVASRSVPDTDETVRSVVVSPDWTV